MSIESSKLASQASADGRTARVITVSTRVAEGTYEDTAGPAAAAELARVGFVVDQVQVVPDGESVKTTLKQAVVQGIDVVITCGGTGLTPQDQTPEFTAQVVDREVPGIADFLRVKVWDSVPNAALSRGIAGIAENTLIINVPGSKKAAIESVQLLASILPHAIDQIGGGDHERHN
ncbi:MAG: molybdenum cofactor synthesis domain-containing protein [Candidatus Nanopelagicales bacterium]